MDGEGVLTWVNDAFLRLSGSSGSAQPGRPLHLLAAEDLNDDTSVVLWETLRRGASYNGELAWRRADGSLCTLDGSVTPFAVGRATSYVGICRDSTPRLRFDREREDLVYYDPLSGLATPRLMRERARQILALARRNGTTAALLHVDLDRYADVNSRYGRSTGDDVLRLLAGRLRQGVRESDSVSRIGSDEFLVLLSEVADNQAIARIVRRVQEQIGRPFHVNEHTITVRATAGVALYPQDGSGYDELVSCAEAAVRRAQGRGTTFEFFEQTQTTATTEGLTLEDEMSLAWQNEEFLLHYQPIVGADGEIVGAEALTRGQVIGVEALARWPHSQRGMVGPGQFIPLAERTGRILSLDRWAIATAARQAAAWSATGWRGWVSVNLSARTLHDPDLPDYFARTLAAHRLEAGRLVIEITESTAMRDPSLTAQVLTGLRAAGARIAVDDFGVGHSSLAYLKLFPVDLLKLDACFVRELGTGSRDEQLVEIMITLAHCIGAQVVAEGVEETQQLEWLRRAGCDYVQGYLLGEPVPPDRAPILNTRPD